jgi:hypothetical protein
MQAERHEGELSDAKRLIGEQRKKIEVVSSPQPHRWQQPLPDRTCNPV